MYSYDPEYAMAMQCPPYFNSSDRLKDLSEEPYLQEPQRELSPSRQPDFDTKEETEREDSSVSEVYKESRDSHVCNIDCVKDSDEDRHYFQELCLDEGSEKREFEYWHMIPKTVIDYNILVIGEKGVGKTTLVKEFAFKEVARLHSKNDKFNVIKKIYRLDMLTKLNLKFIKISGVKARKLTAHKNYAIPHGAMFMYDLTKPSTFQNFPKLKQELDRNVVLSDGSAIPCILIGTKCDKMKSMEQEYVKMEEMCSKYQFCNWYETSAKEMINVRLCFLSLITKIYQQDAMHKRGPIATNLIQNEESCNIF